MPLQPFAEKAQEHGLLLWEDCAQAFDGRYAGHPEADAVMFSFGPIKTATALGGVIVALAGPDPAYIVNAVTFLVSAVLILRIAPGLLQQAVGWPDEPLGPTDRSDFSRIRDRAARDGVAGWAEGVWGGRGRQRVRRTGATCSASSR